MSNFLSNLGSRAKKTVGISISTNNLIEMVCIDNIKHSILKYASREVKYNNAIKEIVDEQEFTAAVIDLFKELDLQPSLCNIILVLPNVHFAFGRVSLLIPDDQISNTLLYEVEQLYLFKRYDPVIAWSSVDTNNNEEDRKLIYSAIQDNVLNNVRNVFRDIGANLIAVETSNSALLRGIFYSRIIDQELSSGADLNILSITSNTFSIYCMRGYKLVDYYEEPLAIKSFTNDEVYIAIASAADRALENYPTRNLLIISETDEVNSELLAEKLNFDGAVKYLDRNKYANNCFLPVDSSVIQNCIPYISLEVIGAASYFSENNAMKLNYISGDEPDGVIVTLPFLGTEIEINITMIRILVGSITVILLIIMLIFALVLKGVQVRLEKQITTLTKEEQTLSKKLSENNLAPDAASIYSISHEIYTNNKNEVALFEGVATEIPKQVWVEYIKFNADGEVYIKGKSVGSQNIYSFFKGLKRVNSNIYISKLELDFNNMSALNDNLQTENTLFSFEIDSSKNKQQEPADPSATTTTPAGQPLQNTTNPIPVAPAVSNPSPALQAPPGTVPAPSLPPISDIQR